jgi:hypothetical protein
VIDNLTVTRSCFPPESRADTGFILPNSPGLSRENTNVNTEKSLALASALFPGEEWVLMVLDGEILEIKAVIGAIKTLGLEFKRGYKQGKSLLERLAPPMQVALQEHSVFIHLISDFKVEVVKTKTAGEPKNRLDQGRFICFLEQTGKLYEWSYEELRAIIGKM